MEQTTPFLGPLTGLLQGEHRHFFMIQQVFKCSHPQVLGRALLMGSSSLMQAWVWDLTVPVSTAAETPVPGDNTAHLPSPGAALPRCCAMTRPRGINMQCIYLWPCASWIGTGSAGSSRVTGCVLGWSLGQRYMSAEMVYVLNSLSLTTHFEFVQTFGLKLNQYQEGWGMVDSCRLNHHQLQPSLAKWSVIYTTLVAFVSDAPEQGQNSHEYVPDSSSYPWRMRG